MTGLLAWKKVKSVRLAQSGTCDYSSSFGRSQDNQVGEANLKVYILLLLLLSSLLARSLAAIQSYPCLRLLLVLLLRSDAQML